MNDLDRGLRTLFEEKARDVQPSPIAPADVLRRGRRRQFASALVAGVFAFALIGLGVAGFAVVSRGPAEVPADPGRSSGYPERTVTIQGITVTAPQGWTLTDLWPMAAYIGTDVTECSFTGTGTPVGEDGTDGGPAEEPQESCTTSPSPLPAGIPVLQLSNSDLGLPAICSIQDGDAASLPADGAALYVAAFPAGRSTSSLAEVCPTGASITTSGQGEMTYAAVVAIGPEAPAADAAWVRDQANALSTQGLPLLEAPAANGPGYVVAAGSSGGFGWRLEAGLNPPSDVEALGIGGVLIVTDDHGSESMSSVRLPTDVPAVTQSDELGDGFITWGAADPTVTSVEVILDDGSAAPTTMVEWPESMEAFLEDSSPLHGSLWWTVAPTAGRTARLTSGTETVTVPVEDAFPGDV
jgi:hypothetical protein